MTFWKKQNYRNRKVSSGLKRLGVGRVNQGTQEYFFLMAPDLDQEGWTPVHVEM